MFILSSSKQINIADDRLYHVISVGETCNIISISIANNFLDRIFRNICYLKNRPRRGQLVQKPVHFIVRLQMFESIEPGVIHVARNLNGGPGLSSLPPSVPPVGGLGTESQLSLLWGLGAVPQKTGVRGYNPRFLCVKYVCDSVHFWHVLGVIFYFLFATS